MNKQVVGSVSL